MFNLQIIQLASEKNSEDAVVTFGKLPWSTLKHAGITSHAKTNLVCQIGGHRVRYSPHCPALAGSHPAAVTGRKTPGLSGGDSQGVSRYQE